MLSALNARFCAAAILAGGRARRLGGRDKAALRIGGARIIDRQTALLREVADYVYIVANEPARYADLGVPIVPDVLPGRGALGGIYSALAASPRPQTVIVACDMPFVSLPFLRHLVEAGREVDAAVPRTHTGLQPLCASYSDGCLEPIRRRLDAGTLRVIDALADLRVREIGPEELTPFDPDGALFLNVNTLEDYARALALVDRQNE